MPERQRRGLSIDSEKLTDFSRRAQKSIATAIEKGTSSLIDAIPAVEDAKEQRRLMMESAMRALSNAVEAKDTYTRGHAQRVAEYAKMIARSCGESEEYQERIYHAGLLHDIGKIRIPDAVLNKPGKLTHEEFEVIRLHTSAGYYILREISQDLAYANAARWHHERFDGKGYPDGLAGDDIPKMARIIAVADTYDAMTSSRIYRETMPQNLVYDEIKRCSGTQFDPKYAKAMLKLIAEDKDFTMRQHKNAKSTILVVDPEKIMRRTLKYMLSENENYDILLAKNADELMETVMSRNIDLVLLDVGEDGSGFETFEMFRSLSAVPVIFMTASREHQYIMKIMSYDDPEYVIKPFYKQTLFEVVSHSLRER